MNFDRAYLDLEPVAANRARRDKAIRDAGVEDLDAFKAHMRESEVENECGTDEYRETQPSKGMSFIAEFMEDGGPGREADNEMKQLVAKWFKAIADNPNESYAGADELVPILNACFDYRWEVGYYSLYQPFVDNFEGLEYDVKVYEGDF